MIFKKKQTNKYRCTFCGVESDKPLHFFSTAGKNWIEEHQFYTEYLLRPGNRNRGWQWKRVDI